MQNNELKPKRCAIYARVSTDMGLSQEFNSVDSQVESCRHYINAHAAEGWIEQGVYRDKGISGSTTDRPELQRMLQDVRERKIDQIVVYKIDRLSRNLRAFLDMQAIFSRHDCTMASTTEPYDTGTYMGRAMLNLLGVFAEMERERIRERICDKIAATRAKGLWSGGLAPFGYKVNKQRLEVEPEAASIVKRIFEMRLAGEFPRAISHTLNKESKFPYNRKMKACTKWTASRVFKLLRNATYAGYVIHRDKLYEGQHERIISRDKWDKVQKLMDSERMAPNATAPRNTTIPYPLAGVLYCKRCGSRMVGTYTRKSGKIYRYYVCRRSQTEGKIACACSRLSAEAVEEYMIGEMKYLAQNEELLAALVAELPDWNPQYVGDCLFNIESVLRNLQPVELGEAFRCALSKVEFDDEKMEFTIKRKK